MTEHPASQLTSQSGQSAVQPEQTAPQESAAQSASSPPQTQRSEALTTTEGTAKKQRLEWLDALRGFTMILVVAFHVSQIGFGEKPKMSSSLSFFLLFRMPLFFFISGFLAYKAGLLWDLTTFLKLTAKKLRVQIVPTVVFFFFAMAVLQPKFWPAVEAAWHSPFKGGYWFTIALLYMFLVYYIFAYAESKILKYLGRWSWVPILLLFIVSLLLYESCFLPKYFEWAQGHKGGHPNSQFLFDTSLIKAMEYFPFFVFGNIVRRYWPIAQRVMDSRWFYPVIIVIVIFSALDVLKWHTLRMAWANLPNTLAKFLLLTIVFMYFRCYQKYFTRFTVIGASLQYIGRRTLDIYLIHYLFMPNLPGVGQFFHTFRHNFAIDTTLSVIIALIVIGFSCVTSNILRVSPFFKKWLFGR